MVYTIKLENYEIPICPFNRNKQHLKLYHFTPSRNLPSISKYGLKSSEIHSNRFPVELWAKARAEKYGIDFEKNYDQQIEESLKEIGDTLIFATDYEESSQWDSFGDIVLGITPEYEDKFIPHPYFENGGGEYISREVIPPKGLCIVSGFEKNRNY